MTSDASMYIRGIHRGRWGVATYILVLAALGNLIWESAQLPLYTLWYTDNWGSIVFAVIHCTGGDVLIMIVALTGAMFLAGGRNWPRERYAIVAAVTITLSVTYTIFSEWNNTVVYKTWAYSELMPTLPVLGTGLSPLLQWIVVPLAAFWLARVRQPYISRTDAGG